MSALDELWAVVVNWNGGELNLACLASLVNEGLSAEHIVFVDNASSDGSLELVERAHPGLVILRNDANLGFGEAANQGARRGLEGGAQSVLYVNNDLTFEPGCIATLAEELAARPGIGVLGPRVLHAEDPTRVWCAGGRLDYRQNLSTLVGFGERDGPEHQRDVPVDYIPGCSLLIRREVLEEVGGYDASYFAYMEDVELCLRVREAGHEVRLIGAVAALHRSSSSTGGGYNPRRKYMMGVNSVRFLRQHGDAVSWARFALFDVCTLPPLLVAGAFNGRAAAVFAKGRGILDGLRGKRVRAEDAAG